MNIADYLSELLIDVNLALSVVPRLLTTVMIARAIPAAISPYSIAVAPDSSFRNCTNKTRTSNPPDFATLKLSSGFPRWNLPLER